MKSEIESGRPSKYSRRIIKSFKSFFTSRHNGPETEKRDVSVDHRKEKLEKEQRMLIKASNKRKFIEREISQCKKTGVGYTPHFFEEFSPNDIKYGEFDYSYATEAWFELKSTQEMIKNRISGFVTSGAEAAIEDPKMVEYAKKRMTEEWEYLKQETGMLVQGYNQKFLKNHYGIDIEKKLSFQNFFGKDRLEYLKQEKKRLDGIIRLFYDKIELHGGLDDETRKLIDAPLEKFLLDPYSS